MDSFVGALGLERSYTMLVVNPKWSPSLPSYTYRIGFSEPELRLLHAQVCLCKGWHVLACAAAVHMDAVLDLSQAGRTGQELGCIVAG